MEETFAIFKTLFELNPLCTILTTLENGVFIDVNHAFYQNTGFEKEEVIGRSSIDIGIWLNPLEREEIKHLMIKSRKLSHIPGKMRIKSGEVRNVIASGQLIKAMGETYWLSVIMDMESQYSLEASVNDRETQIEILSNKFYELNLLLRSLGDDWGKKKAAIDSRLKSHLNVHVFQFIEKIKHCKKKCDIQTYISVIEHNLKDLSMVISDNWQDVSETLTPFENKVSKLVRQGKSSKEIAEQCKLPTKTIFYHRSNIRRKLNLVNKKINLAKYLRNQQTLS